MDIFLMYNSYKKKLHESKGDRVMYARDKAKRIWTRNLENHDH